MGRALVLAILAVAAPVAIAGQTLVVLHIRAVLTDATGRATPVARHSLIISDNPQTRESRRILTGLDGTANVRMRPGNYTVESDQPLVFQGKAYHWRQTLDIVAGRDSGWHSLNERLTFDRDVTFVGDTHEERLSRVVIGEVKQAQYSNHHGAVAALRGLHVREATFSKYCVGTTLVAAVADNIFKPTLKAVERLSA